MSNLRKRLINGSLVFLVLFFLGIILFFINQQKAGDNRLSIETAKEVGGYGEKTTGGSKATKKETFVVTDRQELLHALGKQTNDLSKIIVVKGTIDMSQNEHGLSQNEDNYTFATKYTFDKYLEMYNPSVYGKNKPSGSQEEEREKAQKNQAKQISIHVPGNTTILGEHGAKIVNGTMILNQDNVIVRNLIMEAPYDYFPQWDPTDAKTGNWNAQYDAISIEGAKTIWIDHNTFTDGAHLDNGDGTYFGRDYQHHDGLTDITNGADEITISTNFYEKHDKTILIGNSDSKKSDKGKLHVSLIGNVFMDTVQRTPRVRFGQVELINNLYKESANSVYPFKYAWGIGKESHLVAKNNVFDLPDEKAKKIARKFGGDYLSDEGTEFDGNELSVHEHLNTKAGSLITQSQRIRSTEEVEQQDEKEAGATLEED